MLDTEPNAILREWPAAARAGGRAEAADVLERWLADEGAGLGALGSGSLQARALLERAGVAFARLGAGVRAAGLGLDDLAALVDALHGVVPAPDTESRTGLAALHGLAVGGWHAEADHDDAHGASPATPGGDPFASLDPAVGKLIRHDIKTPLQAASLNLELLAMEQEGNPEVTGQIETIMQSLDSAVAMLRRFDDV